MRSQWLRLLRFPAVVTSAKGGKGVPTETSGLLIPGTGTATGNTSAQGENTGVSHSSSQPAAQQIQVGQPPVSQDIYNQALLYTLLSQQAQLASAGQSGVSVQGPSNINVQQANSASQEFSSHGATHRCILHLLQVSPTRPILINGTLFPILLKRM